MEWKIPLADIDVGEDEFESVVKVLHSKWPTLGTYNFEKAFADFLGVKHAFAVANCTAALSPANRALGISGGDEERAAYISQALKSMLNWPQYYETDTSNVQPKKLMRLAPRLTLEIIIDDLDNNLLK